MAESIVSGILKKLLEYAGNYALKEIAPYFGGRDKLEELQQTMKMIQARLLDAERRREDEDGALVKEWLKSLKRVLHKLEDLFEEVTMADMENEQVPGGELSKCFHILFSRFCPSEINKTVTQETEAILKELKVIESQMLSLNLRVHSVGQNHLVSFTNGRETTPFIQEKDVIGREDDKRAIIDMILHPNSSNDVHEGITVIPIIGIGGLGKTTLAQFVFNDEDMQQHFELKVWACISEASTLEVAPRIILTSIRGGDCHQLSMEWLQARLREALNNKKYLIVLDDVWDEDLMRWRYLKGLLCGCKQGSIIIVTSRSEVVAKNMAGTMNLYKLGGLSEVKSWELFRSIAFEKGQDEMNPNMTSIGREIVKKCANVPLAIRAIAGILHSRDTEQEWQYFKDSELSKIEHNENSIMSTLKLSYDHLSPSQLKQCFAYCSLFPKDYRFNKQDLIYLWMAQGFIEEGDGSHQRPEDLGHAYFMELLRRSFFQDADFDDYHGIDSCKMHDLMNDLARNVAGDECLLLDRLRPAHQIYNGSNIWHVNCMVEQSMDDEEAPGWEIPSSLLAGKRMRSLLYLNSKILNINDMFSSLRCLRALDLGKAHTLPDSIGDLRHLKYLRLCGLLEYLPEGITRLQYLQTLDVLGCRELKGFPRGFNKLVSLRHLDFESGSIIDMPSRFGQLTCLQSLAAFVVGTINGLGELDTLNKLAGKLEICFRGVATSEANVGILKRTMLTLLVVVNGDDLELECLQPPSTLRRLVLWGFEGVRIPRWGMDELLCLLPNLVNVVIEECDRCQHLPPFSRLPHLKYLTLSQLAALEYMESESASSETPHFPSLQKLRLSDLAELKEWSKSEDDNIHGGGGGGGGGGGQRHEYQHQCFPCLPKLEIIGCPKLMSMPLMPRAESIKAVEIHGKLLKQLVVAEESLTYSSLRELYIDSVSELDLVSIKNLVSLESLYIGDCHELMNLVAESTNSLRQLEIDNCVRLRDISGALQHLSVLEELQINDCDELEVSGGGWEGLKRLRSLTLNRILNLESLPSGLGCLTTLEELTMEFLDNLVALPEWIGHLTQLRWLSIQDCPLLTRLPDSFRNLASLKELRIRGCPELEERCEGPDGEDWPLIQHISTVYL